MSRTIGFDQAFTVEEGDAFTFKGAEKQSARTLQRRKTNRGVWSADVERSGNRFIRRWRWRVARSNF